MWNDTTYKHTVFLSTEILASGYLQYIPDMKLKRPSTERHRQLHLHRKTSEDSHKKELNYCLQVY